MPITFACPGCAKGFRVNDEMAGRASKCPACGTALTVPSQAAFAARPTAPAAPNPWVDDVPAETVDATPRPTWARGTGNFKRIAIVGAILLALGGTAAGGGLVYWAFFSPAGLAADELKYLPDNCQTIASVRVEQLLASKAYQELKGELPEGLKDWDKNVEKFVGIPVANVDRLVFGGSFGGKDGEMLIVVRTLKPTSADEIKAALKNAQFQEEKAGNTTIYKQMFGPSFAVPDKNIVVFGIKADTLKKAIERDKKPELSDGLRAAMKEADFSKTMAYATDFKEMLAKSKPADGLTMGFNLNDYIDADAVESSSGSLACGTDIRFNTVSLCKDSATAEDSRKMADGLMAFLKRFKKAPDGTDLKPLQEIITTWESSTSGAKVKGGMVVKTEQVGKLIKESKKAEEKGKKTFQKVGQAIGQQ